MATIKLAAVRRDGIGVPEATAEYRVWIKRQPWLGGGTTNVLCLAAGVDTLEIWPADAATLEDLASKLTQIAATLKGEAKDE